MFGRNPACRSRRSSAIQSRTGPGPTFKFTAVARGVAAFTLVETLVAAAVTLGVLGAIFFASSHCLQVTKVSGAMGSASAVVAERLQQLQGTNWEILTNSESYSDQVWTDPEDNTTETVHGLLKNPTQAGADLRAEEAVEVVTISAYRPTPSASPIPAPIVATRSGTSVTVSSPATNLVDENLVRIDVRLTWTDGRARTQRALAVSGIAAKR